MQTKMIASCVICATELLCLLFTKLNAATNQQQIPSEAQIHNKSFLIFSDILIQLQSLVWHKVKVTRLHYTNECLKDEPVNSTITEIFIKRSLVWYKATINRTSSKDRTLNISYLVNCNVSVLQTKFNLVLLQGMTRDTQ